MFFSYFFYRFCNDSAATIYYPLYLFESCSKYPPTGYIHIHLVVDIFFFYRQITTDAILAQFYLFNETIFYMPLNCIVYSNFERNCLKIVGKLVVLETAVKNVLHIPSLSFIHEHFLGWIFCCRKFSTIVFMFNTLHTS